MHARLVYEHIEKFFRLKEELRRQVMRPKGTAKLLYLDHSGTLPDPDAAFLQKAYLMQVRLALEARLDTGPQVKVPPPRVKDPRSESCRLP